MLSECQAGQRAVAGTVGGILQCAQGLPSTAAAGIRPQSYFTHTAVAPMIWEGMAGILTPPNLEPREGCLGSLLGPQFHSHRGVGVEGGGCFLLGMSPMEARLQDGPQDYCLLGWVH